MWVYEKKLEYPVKVSGPNPKLAKAVITQYGGPDGELAASLRYLTQRYSMPTSQAKGVLTDMALRNWHMEIVAAIVYNLLKNAPLEQIKAAGMEGYYADTTDRFSSSTATAFRGSQPTSNRRETPSLTSTRTWRPKRRPGRRMNT